MSLNLTNKLLKRMRRFYRNRHRSEMLSKYRRKARLGSKTIVHFLHIGKTGGSAIKHALGRDKPYVNDDYIVFCHPHTFRLDQVLKGEKFFFVLRDPVDRFVSGFYSRQRKGMPRTFHEWTDGEKTAFETFSTPGELAAAISSNDLKNKEAAHKAMVSIDHVNTFFIDWFGSEDSILSRIEDLIVVARQETLNDDFEKVKSRLGINKSITLPEDPVKAHKNPEGLDKHLDETAIENIKNWYSKDYEFIEFLKKHGLF